MDLIGLVLSVATSAAGNWVSKVLESSREARSTWADDASRAALHACLKAGAGAFCDRLVRDADGQAETVVKGADAFLREGQLADQLVRLVLSEGIDRAVLWERFQGFCEFRSQFRALLAMVPEGAFREAVSALEDAYRRERKVQEAVGGRPQEDVRTQAQVGTRDATREVARQVARVAGPTEEELVRAYLEKLVGRTAELDVTAVDPNWQCLDGTGKPRGVRVADVFTTLRIESVAFAAEESSQRPRLSALGIAESAEGGGGGKPTTAVAAIGRHRRLVIVGRPGGGKSTLTRHLVTQLALRRLGREDGQTEVAEWPAGESPVPVPVVLREFTAWLGKKKATKGHEGLLWKYLQDDELPRLGCATAFPALKAVCEQEGGIVFFDGLDEVGFHADNSLRVVISETVADLAKCFKGRIVVTSRDYAYRQTDRWRLPPQVFPVAALSPFDDGQIREFAGTWYRMVRHTKGWDEGRAESEAASLSASIRKRGGVLRQMAGNPLLLTMIVQVHATGGPLPGNRAELYGRVASLMLHSWENRVQQEALGTGAAEGEVQRLGLGVEELRKVLEAVAFAAHETQERLSGGKDSGNDSAADIPRHMLVGALVEGLGRNVDPERVIHYFECRAGLLEDKDNRTFSFCHRSFQEYFAALYLRRQADPFAMLAERLVPERAEWWREVYLLTAGCYRDTPRDVRSLFEVVCPPRRGAETKTSAPGLLLGAQALVETDFRSHALAGGDRAEPFRELFERARDRLLSAATARRGVRAAERCQAGAILAQLGDPRPEATTVEGMAFCLVPKGAFWLGDGPESKEPGCWAECLSEDIYLGRFPVTNEQFQAFVEAGGYGRREFWAEALAHGRWREGKVKIITFAAGKLEETWVGGPRVYPGRLPNHPVVGVSWYEAMAFCHWLDAQLRSVSETSAGLRELLERGYRAGLPAETEWEKAARGGRQVPSQALVGDCRTWVRQAVLVANPDPQREYPWIGNAAPERANYEETAIGSTSAVGCFPKGVSPCGCEDMAGNVWEWTRSRYVESAEDLGVEAGLGKPLEEGDVAVVRGGAFWDVPADLRCACRGRVDPDDRGGDLGFRVVLSPFLRS
jgi:formylglycine-generating enzyme required for sulfatase activity